MKNLFETARQKLAIGLPFVLYRKPGEAVIKAQFQKDSLLHTTFTFDGSGFIFSPFNHDQPSVLFPRDNCDSMEIEFSNNDQRTDTFSTSTQNNIETSKNKHIGLVTSGIQAIQTSPLKKVVLSRIEEVPEVKEDPITLFLKLLSNYPDAFVYVWHHPKIGTWLGATPETLVSIEGNSLKTMSLAGTQSYMGSCEVLWGAKEIEEQEMVTDFIVKALKKHTDVVKSSSVKTFRAGSLLHLKTDIDAVIGAQNNDLTSVIKAIHPTPAVCGLPRNKAKKFILENEGYDRNFYTGFLGELNINKEQIRKTHLFVNLRCMEIETTKALLYVGGGITKDSDPLKEWDETVKKTSTMKTVLFSQ